MTVNWFCGSAVLDWLFELCVCVSVSVCTVCMALLHLEVLGSCVMLCIAYEGQRLHDKLQTHMASFFNILYF